jgi:hypothetical protein
MLDRNEKGITVKKQAELLANTALKATPARSFSHTLTEF